MRPRLDGNNIIPGEPLNKERRVTVKYFSRFEVEEIRGLINSTSNLEKYYQAATKQGMRSLRISGAQKIAEGLTTLEEIYSIVTPGKNTV